MSTKYRVTFQTLKITTEAHRALSIEKARRADGTSLYELASEIILSKLSEKTKEDNNGYGRL